MGASPQPARRKPAGARCQGRRGGRVVEGARLESVFTGNRNAGSNPALSASYFPNKPMISYTYIIHEVLQDRSDLNMRNKLPRIRQAETEGMQWT